MRMCMRSSAGMDSLILCNNIHTFSTIYWKSGVKCVVCSMFSVYCVLHTLKYMQILRDLVECNSILAPCLLPLGMVHGTQAVRPHTVQYRL